MCGVLGIKGETSLGQGKILLQMLTHRGQDASGLAWTTADDSKVNMAKIDGYPDLIDIKEDKNVNKLLGSTRYPTFGTRTDSSNIDLYAQPFQVKTKYGTLTIVHNGNITNISSLKKERKYECDAQFIAEYLGDLINKFKGDLSLAVTAFMENVDGSYSNVGILGEQIFTYRDPKGIRPLVIGKNEEITVVSSESVVLQNMGIHDFVDVNPGELITFSNCEWVRNQLKQSDHAHCMFEYVYFANPTSIMEGHLVYESRIDLGRALAAKIEQANIDIDYVVPVPDTSRPATQGLAEVIDKPVREAIIKNRYLQRTFIMKSESERSKAAKRKYLYISSYIEGKSLLIVDDSIVRGLTSKKIVKDLRALGAKKVYMAVTCPAIRFPCYFGVDFPTDDELIGSGHTIQEIKEMLDVDGVYYQSIEALKSSIGLKDICTACISGSYPTAYTSELRVKYLNGELKSNSHYEG